MLKDLFLPTVQLKVLSFFVLHSGETFHERAVARQTKISLGGTNAALRSLQKQGILTRQRVGRNVIFALNDSLPALYYFKLLNILVLLEPMIASLKTLARRVILFGSFARGENTRGSDIDLLIVSNQKEQVPAALEKFAVPWGKNGIEIQPVIRTTAEWMRLEKKDPIFFEEISRGITLWDEQQENEK